MALLETHPLAQQESVAVRSLADEFFIMFPRHLGLGLYDQILSVCLRANFSPNVTQQANQMQTIIGLVSAGMGIAIVPSSLQNLQRGGVVYCLLDEQTPLVETSVVWQQENIMPALRKFLQAVSTICGQSIKKLI